MNIKKFSIAAFATASLLVLSTAGVMASDAWANQDTKVRDDASTSADVIDYLAEGEHVNVVDCDYGWCYVKHPGPDGWVKKSKLDFNYDNYDDADVSFGLYGGPGGVSFGISISN
jgi:SH3-like domain-containing protein